MFEEEMATTCFANRLRSAARVVSREYDAAYKPLGLKVSQVSVLAAVSLGRGKLTIIDIAERLSMDRSTLSRNLEPLERQGLIALGAEQRHRARLVELTEAGAALLAKAYPLWKTAQETVTARFAGAAEMSRQLDDYLEQKDRQKPSSAGRLDDCGTKRR